MDMERRSMEAYTKSPAKASKTRAIRRKARIAAAVRRARVAAAERACPAENDAHNKRAEARRKATAEKAAAERTAVRTAKREAKEAKRKAAAEKVKRVEAERVEAKRKAVKKAARVARRKAKRAAAKIKANNARIDAQCSICHVPVGQEENGETEGWSVLPCGHRFGSRCIKSWLCMEGGIKCPSCNGRVVHVCGHRKLPRAESPSTPGGAESTPDRPTRAVALLEQIEEMLWWTVRQAEDMREQREQRGGLELPAWMLRADGWPADAQSSIDGIDGESDNDEGGRAGTEEQPGDGTSHWSSGGPLAEIALGLFSNEWALRLLSQTAPRLLSPMTGTDKNGNGAVNPQTSATPFAATALLRRCRNVRKRIGHLKRSELEDGQAYTIIAESEDHSERVASMLPIAEISYIAHYPELGRIDVLRRLLESARRPDNLSAPCYFCTMEYICILEETFYAQCEGAMEATTSASSGIILRSPNLDMIPWTDFAGVLYRLYCADAATITTSQSVVDQVACRNFWEDWHLVYALRFSSWWAGSVPQTPYQPPLAVYTPEIHLRPLPHLPVPVPPHTFHMPWFTMIAWLDERVGQHLHLWDEVLDELSEDAAEIANQTQHQV